MKLTVLNSRDNPLFQIEDFLDFIPAKQIRVLNLENQENFDGVVFQQVPSDTIHLITWFADSLGHNELLRLPDLKYIGLAYTGWWDKYFDLALLKGRQIVVTNNPYYASNAVAEGIVAALLYRFRMFSDLEFGNSQFQSPLGRELRGKKIGILGLGNIGSRVAEIARGLGMYPISTSTRVVDYITQVTNEKFFKTSDIITLHVPKSAGVVLSSREFSLLNSRSTIVNSSGHENIDTTALIEFLKINSEASYLFLAKPTEEYFSKLSDLQNCFLFPLFASQTEEAEKLRKSVTIDNLRMFLSGGEVKCRVV